MSDTVINIRVDRNRRSKYGCPKAYKATWIGLDRKVEAYGESPKIALHNVIDQRYAQ